MALNQAQKALAAILSQNLLPTGKMKSIGNLSALPRNPDLSIPLPDVDRPKQDAASYILTHASLGKVKPLQATGQTLASHQEDEDASVVSRIFDTLGIPLSLAANSVNEIGSVVQGEKSISEALADTTEEAKSAPFRILDNWGPTPIPGWKPDIPGIDVDNQFYNWVDKQADQSDRTYFADVIKNAGKVKGSPQVFSKGVQTWGGLGLDLLADPLNFVGVGALGAAGKARKALNAADALTEAAATRKGAEAFVRQPKSKPVINPPVAENLGGRIPSAQFGRNVTGETVPRVRLPEQSRNVMRSEVELPEVSNPFPSEVRSNIQRLQEGIPEFSTSYSKANIRSLNAKMSFQGDKLRDINMAKKGIVAKRGRISVTAVNKIIDDIRAGHTPLEGPEIKPLDIEELNQAVRKSADNFLVGTLAKKGAKFTPDRQVLLYTKLFNNIGKAARKANLPIDAAKHQELALSAMKAAEDHLIDLKKNPVYWNGQEVRLSSILADTQGLNPEIAINAFKQSWDSMDSPIVQEAVTRSLARRSVMTGSVMTNLSKHVEQAKNIIEDPIFKRPFDKAKVEQIVKNLNRLGDQSKLTHQEVQSLKNMLRATVDADKLPNEFILDKSKDLLTKAVQDGKANPDVINQELSTIAKVFGKDDIKQLDVENPTRMATVVPAFMMRFTTWWGRKDVAKVQDDIFGWGSQNARFNGEKMRNIQKHYSDDEAREAWNVAAGRVGPQNAKVGGLATIFRKEMEHMFGSSGLKDEIMDGAAGTPVAWKSQLAIHDINKELKRTHVTFRFSDSKKVEMPDGSFKDFSKNADWLHSWESYSPKDPAAFLYDINLAMENVTKRYIFMDELGARFGSKAKRGEFQYSIPEPRLEGFYFNKEMAGQIRRTIEMFDDPAWRTPNGFGWFVRGTRLWKISKTLWNPVHHVRNMIGDSWLMWMGGINDPRVFIKSQRILHTQRSRYQNALKGFDESDSVGSYEAMNADLDPLLNRYAAEIAETRNGDVISSIRSGKNTIRITADQYYIQAHKHNLLLDANAAEDIFGQSPFGRVATFGPLSATHHQITKVAEYREHYVRMAHFVGETEKLIKKGVSKNRAFDLAAQATRKWHPDGRDLTKFEQNVRMFIPFYSWLRKSTPLIIQGLAQRPAKVLAYPKIMTAISQQMGIDASIEDPFPDDQLFPDWIRAYGIGPIGDPRADGLSGFIGRELGKTAKEDYTDKPLGYTVVNPSNPMIDFFQQYFGTGKPNEPVMGMLESLNPMIRAPYEIGTGRSLTGAPIGDDPGNYINELAPVPLVGPAGRIFNTGVFGDTAQAEKDESNFDREALINWLTGAGVRGTGPYIKSAEFDARERAKRYAERKVGKRGY